MCLLSKRIFLTVSGLMILGSIGCRSSKTEVVVYYASSLSAVMGDLAAAYEQQHSKVRIRLEPSGSQVAARKVTELGMRPDLVAVADASLLRKILIPTHSRFNLIFATNEIVLAHKDHSPHTDQITSANWPEILTRSDVRLGRADPDTAPIGYQTLMVWQLAEFGGQGSSKDLSARLKAKCAKAQVAQDESDLLALLESRAIDYAFLFRSTAEDHRLKILTLPTEINLSRPEMAAQYAKAKVAIRMRQGEGESHVVGGPITYGVTIPIQAPHAAEAARFLAFWLSDEGGRFWVRRGFHRMSPARCDPCTDLPPLLTSFLGGPPR